MEDVNMDTEREHQERRMHLEALERDTPRVWRELRADYKVDKEFILQALQSPRLPNKSDFERQFPQSLRFDRDVVLAFCARPDFKEIYYERHLFVPDCLTSDKDVMLAYCRQIPRSLQECSPELCDDREVVEAAISLDGLELQYASTRLQEDPDIVVTACESNGQALELCPRGPVRDRLTSDRDFMLRVLRKHGGPMLRLVSDPLRNDRELLLEALKHGMRYRWCPFDFQNDKSFVQEALTHRSTLYMEMNRTTQTEEDLARAAIVSDTSTPEVHERALGHQPTLTKYRDVALALARRGETGKFWEYLIDGTPSYRGDREIMLTAVQRNPKIFSRVTPALQRDVEVVLAAIQHDTSLTVLNIVGGGFQQAHPHVTVKAIMSANLSSLRLMQGAIPNVLWANFDVAVAWMQRLHRVPVGSNSLLTNRDFCLAIARYAHRQFPSVAENLRSDYNFMREAVEINGLVLRHAGSLLRHDLELVVRAVASNRNALCSLIPFSFAQVQQHVKGKLDLHRTFLTDFLRGIAISTPRLPPSMRSQLPLLDRGVETSQAFKQLIAEFLGVPVGAELVLLRRAMNKLQNPASSDEPAGPDEDGDVFVDVLDDPEPAMPALARRMRQRRMWHFHNRRAAANGNNNRNDDDDDDDDDEEARNRGRGANVPDFHFAGMGGDPMDDAANDMMVAMHNIENNNGRDIVEVPMPGRRHFVRGPNMPGFHPAENNNNNDRRRMVRGPNPFVGFQAPVMADDAIREDPNNNGADEMMAAAMEMAVEEVDLDDWNGL
uniref:DUF4116 domain-containing protein n=1 Tax=Amphora coffeiformis TaxID=265554 RepID=A0A7S3P3V4_9STRA|mmetsp:Transcript_13287/g.26862  ORF Transcript_13287/g.26862 Transcript_13287/m.26862 type:complete len:778 (-) Transcript_13287:105-2438(-)